MNISKNVSMLSRLKGLRPVLLCLIMLSPFWLRASHLLGVHLSYECYSGCTVKVSIKSYLDCGGVGASSSALSVVTPGGCLAPVPLSVTGPVITEVTPGCPGVTCCDFPAGSCPAGVKPGVNEHAYERLYAICGAPCATPYTFSYADCCRNMSINSLVSPASTSIYAAISVVHPVLSGCNSSPVLNIPPIIYVCDGFSTLYDPDGYDPDGDSLSYSMTSCMDASGIPVTYNVPGGFSVANPLGPGWFVMMDGTTGEMAFSPTTGGAVTGVICVNVTEWIAGVPYNTVTRDIQVIVQLCDSASCTNLVSGRLYRDFASDCVENAPDYGVSGIPLLINGGPLVVPSKPDGSYKVWFPSASWSIEPQLPPGYDFICPASGILSGAFPGPGFDTLTGQDFALNDSFNYFGGRVFLDLDSDAIYGVGDYPIPGAIVRDSVTGTVTTSLTDGTYNLRLPSGPYYIYSSFPVSPSLGVSYPASGAYDGSFPGWSGFITTGDFAYESPGCPQMTISISHDSWRACIVDELRMEVCNYTGIAPPIMMLTIELEDSLQLIGWGNLPPGIIVGTTLTSFVSSPPAFGCNEYYIVVRPACTAAIAGLTFCVTAAVFPDTSCTAPSPVWDHSSVSVEGDCSGDSLACFTVENTGSPGSGDMDGPTEYRVYVDGALYILDSLELCGGCDTVMCFAAAGHTIRLEVDQRPGHPGSSLPNANVEDCGDTTSVLGVIPAMPSHDGDPFADTDCSPIVGSYDPNSKEAYPVGLTAAHYINGEGEIEYTIHFQNTGTAQAFDVILRDTLSPLLDITTLYCGPSSHSYTWGMTGTGLLEVAYMGINLPDSGSDYYGSMGYMTFTVKPKSGLPDGTVIENAADIYFDINPPVRTNTVFHTIHDTVICGTPQPVFSAGISMGDLTITDFTWPVDSIVWDFGDGTTITTSSGTTVMHSYAAVGMYNVCATAYNFCGTATTCEVVNVLVTEIRGPSGLSLSVYPNPFSEVVTFEISGEGSNQSFTLEWMDVTGRVVHNVTLTGAGKHIINRSDLPSGVYMWRMSQNGENLAKGRLVVR